MKRGKEGENYMLEHMAQSKTNTKLILQFLRVNLEYYFTTKDRGTGTWLEDIFFNYRSKLTSKSFDIGTSLNLRSHLV